MNLKFDIQGTVGGKPGRFTGSIDGFEQAGLSTHPRTGRLFDPAEPNGGHALDDPASGEPAGAHGLDDPSEPGGAHALDDPAGNRGGGWRYHPDPGPRPGLLSADSAVYRTALEEPAQVESGVPSPSRLYSGLIIVRLSPLLPLDPVAKSLEAFADSHGFQALKAVLRRFGGPPSRPAIQHWEAGAAVSSSGLHQNPMATGASLEDLERQAATSALRPRHSLRAYWRLDGRSLRALTPAGEEATSNGGLGYSLEEAARSLVEHLNTLSEVDLAYRELTASDPASEVALHEPLREPSAEELADFQLSLGPAPIGLDARWARRQLQGEAGRIAVEPLIALADLEQGWNLNHEDLAALSPGLEVHGANRRGEPGYAGDHGTAVLGQLVGKADNGFGVVGIAEGVAKISLASHYRAAAESSEEGWDRACNGCVADAVSLLMTSGKLGPGSVLLLEVQRAGHPVELDELDFDAIRLATANGILVVEAAGNGGLDLDRLLAEDDRSFDRRSSKFQDSGALMVGAAWPALPHDRASFSNYGSRVDCFAWGGGVTSAGFGDFLGDSVAGTDNHHYTDRFSGTSSAAAMIAGAAALVQALYQENAGSSEARGSSKEATTWDRLSSRQMRSLLSNPKAGTPQGPDVRGRIGVMPDLRKVLDRVLGIVPRVYLRDHEGDDGQAAGRQRRFSSPDIVVSGGPGRKVALQVRNRGLRTALRTKATLYCAPVLTLMTPDRWGLPVGGAESPATAVPQGDLPLLLESSAWRLEPGDHCLIATVEFEGGDEAPRPCRASVFDWPRFLRLLEEQENLAIRNVHSISAEETAKFAINGTPDVARAFSFEVLQRLPQGVSLELTAPLGIAAKFSRGRLWKVRRASDGSDSATLHLPKQPRLPLGTFAVPPSVDFGCSFKLLGEKASVQAGHGIALRQFFKGEEVGRITWEFRC